MSKEERARFFGMDWDNINQKRMMSKMFVAPFLCESASLLFGAAELWDGRVRANEIFQFAFNLGDYGWSMGQSAVGWSDNAPSGSLLCAFGGRWTYMSKSKAEDRLPSKNRESAKRMAEASFLLIDSSLALLHKIPNLPYGNDLAKKIEDKIEILSEAPWALFDCEPLSSIAHQALTQRAALRMCECLCYTSANLWRKGEGDRKLYPYGKKDAEKWLAQGLKFRESAEKQYSIFIDDKCIKESERASILDARDDSPMNIFHDTIYSYYSIEKIHNWEKVISFWIETLYSFCKKSNINNDPQNPILALPPLAQLILESFKNEK
jgi:hypothetical protein